MQDHHPTLVWDYKDLNVDTATNNSKFRNVKWWRIRTMTLTSDLSNPISPSVRLSGFCHGDEFCNNGNQSISKTSDRATVCAGVLVSHCTDTSEYVQYFHHHGDAHLVVLAPSPGSRSVKAKENEGILATDDEEDGEELQV